MYERPESPYSPVKTFDELYLSKLNPALSCLWQRPRATGHFSHSDEVWYCNVPLGKNTLGTFKLLQKYTNHCIRTTAVSLLDECNFEARHVMRVSGHRSETSIRVFRRLNRKKSPMLSVVPVLLEILNQLALQLWRCMSKQVKILLAETQCQTPL